MQVSSYVTANKTIEQKVADRESAIEKTKPSPKKEKIVNVLLAPCLGAGTTCPVLPAPIHLISLNS